MEFYADTSDYDLITPDGYITKIVHAETAPQKPSWRFDHIPSKFVGFKIEKEKVIFNIKSTLAQLGVDGRSPRNRTRPERKRKRIVKLHLFAIGALGKKMLWLLEVGAYVGKLFAQDER